MSAQVAVIMGSKSDLPALKSAFETLRNFGIEFEARVISAHRTPDAAADYAKTAEQRGIKVIICAAGMAAHLAGVIAAHTILPVIGIPVKSSNSIDGWDSILSILQMPSGIPVATMAIDGAKNAALYAVSILALHDETLAARLEIFRREQAEKVLNTEI